jgi:hypothetical protein
VGRPSGNAAAAREDESGPVAPSTLATRNQCCICRVDIYLRRLQTWQRTATDVNHGCFVGVYLPAAPRALRLRLALGKLLLGDGFAVPLGGGELAGWGLQSGWVLRGPGLYTAGREMGRKRKTLEAVLSGRSDKTIRFAPVRTLLISLDFEERVSGSHHVFSRGDIAELINIQEVQGGKVKPYPRFASYGRYWYSTGRS